MPDTYTTTVRNLITCLGRVLTLVPEIVPAACTTWILVNIAKALG